MRKITREFCPNCGSPLFSRVEKCPDLVFLKAGCLDESHLVKPNCQTWTKRAVSWSCIHASLPCFEESRPSKAHDRKAYEFCGEFAYLNVARKTCLSCVGRAAGKARGTQRLRRENDLDLVYHRQSATILHEPNAPCIILDVMSHIR